MNFFNRKISFFFGFALTVGATAWPGTAQAVDLDRIAFQEQQNILRDTRPAPVETALDGGMPKDIRLVYHIEETFDDNIFLSKKKLQNDWITRLAPTLQGSIRSDKTFLYLAGKLDSRIYAIHGHNTSVDPGLTLRTDLFRTSRLKLSLKENFTQRTSIGQASTEKPTKRLVNHLGVSAVFDISPKTSLGLDYNQAVSYYKTIASRHTNQFHNSVRSSFLWRILPKLTLRSSYAFAINDYYYENNGNNLIYHQVMESAEGYITPKSRINLGFGYKYNMYHNRDHRNRGGIVFNGGYHYQWTEKTDIRLFGSRNIYESQNRIINRENAEQSGSQSSDSTLVSTSAGLTINHRLTERLNTRLSGYWGRLERADSSSGTPTTTYLDMATEIGYQINRFLALWLRYDYRCALNKNKDSEYKNNRITCGLRGTFG
ncbi:MAG: hypothetical protein BWY42_01094 [Candidatus Omnitrophica bacterium ADurb.Bin277]|nr:MAG: hypothetical protein BWY42_01094 [Candidatus Omnitrophica bacterium ADurb.Bin277]